MSSRNQHQPSYPDPHQYCPTMASRSAWIKAFQASIFTVLGTLTSTTNLMAQTVISPATSSSINSGQTPAIWPTLLALVVVIAAIVLFGWFMKKLNRNHTQYGNLMHVVSQLPVGPKERVVVVAFQSQWLVLGVTTQQVNLISSAAIPAEAIKAVQDNPATPAFRQWLQAALGRKDVDK
jgi:flagellar protein FliO/FliZ